MIASPAPAIADVLPELNPRLDVAAFKRAFAQSGRVHIPGVLTEISAARILRALQADTPWALALNDGLDAREYDNVSPQKRGQLAIGAIERARFGFQYLYDKHSLSAEGKPYPDPNHYFAKLLTFLNAPHFLSVMREITGIETIAWTDAQATCYRPGDFLTKHDDAKRGAKRSAAYVLNMTPGWRSDWGGILQFLDEYGHIAQGYVPAFNALNLFRVPMVHAVSPVAPFGGNRYSLTGWFHSR